jgi:hypothetical protein
MNFLRSLFSSKSDVSMMRVMSLLSLLIGAYLAIKGKDTSVAVFIYAAFGGKAAQKFVEAKEDNNSKKDL